MSSNFASRFQIASPKPVKGMVQHPSFNQIVYSDTDSMAGSFNSNQFSEFRNNNMMKNINSPTTTQGPNFDYFSMTESNDSTQLIKSINEIRQNSQNPMMKDSLFIQKNMQNNDINEEEFLDDLEDQIIEFD